MKKATSSALSKPGQVASGSGDQTDWWNRKGPADSAASCSKTPDAQLSNNRVSKTQVQPVVAVDEFEDDDPEMEQKLLTCAVNHKDNTQEWAQSIVTPKITIENNSNCSINVYINK